MFKPGTLTRMKWNTKDLVATTDLYSSSTEGPSVLGQDPVLLGMSKPGTKPQCLLLQAPLSSPALRSPLSS